MKKLLGSIFALLIIVNISAGAEADDKVSEISKRMEGIGPGLVGIVSDEYSDFARANSVRLLDVEGYRFYTNLSGLTPTEENPLGSGSGTGQLLFGGVAPFDKMTKIAPILWADRKKVEETLNFYDITNYSDTGPANYVKDESTLETPLASRDGKYDYEEEDNANNELLTENGTAYDNLSSHDINIYAAREFYNSPDTGVKLRHFTHTDKNIERSYNYKFENEDDQNDWEERDYESSHVVARSGFEANPTIREQFDKIDLELGLTANFSMITNTDEKIIEAETEIGQQRLIDEYGEGSAEGDYSREYSYTLDKSSSGASYGLEVDGDYLITPTLKISALADFNYKLLDGAYEKTEIDFIRTSSGIAVANEKYKLKSVKDLESSEWEMGFKSGIEKEINENLLMGAALGYRYSSSENTLDPSRYSVNDQHDLTQIATSTTTQIKNSQVNIPLGVEWQPTGWLSARLGSNYNIQGTKKLITKVEKEFEDNTVAPGNAVVERETTTKTSTGYSYTDSLNFYSGLGFAMTDSLLVDVTGASDTGEGAPGINKLLDLSSWQLGLTLKLIY
ncbi:MAG: hypothetical protein ACQEQC_08710 [Elusimicrobiota bacterium]